ncbi:MAG: helix-turn-helix domain-containing protein [Ruminococcaceae bacterium]|nr:helix-turn-helix domain-containing protein [Oscillospiraceae bacterium]MBR3596558.1 AraC family transcriptional regulator [Clostridia bacterium]
MKKAVLEKAVDVDGVTVPVECIEMEKREDKPDHFAHFHEYLEMLYLLDGQMDIWLNDKHYPFCKGELIVINSNETHRLASVTPVSKYIVIKFTPKLLYSAGQSVKETQYILPFLAEHSEQPRVYKKEFVESSGIPPLILDAMAEWNKKDTGYELALKADVLKTIRHVVAFLSEKGINVKVSSGSGNIQQIISTILEYINENFKTVSEMDVAEHFSISYSYFSRSFKQIMNMSFKEYINYLKINEAQRLLLTTGKSITDISLELGFSSSSHFINVFKKYKNCSPKQYKKNITKS